MMAPNGACPSYQILLLKCSGHYASLSAMFSPLHSATDENSRRSAPATIQSPQKYNTEFARPQLSITASKVQPLLHFAFSYFQPVSQRYKRRTMLAINPVTTENTDDSHLQKYCREAMHCATANRHLWLSAKRNGTQRRAKVSP